MNFNFLVIARLNKREREFIAKVVKNTRDFLISELDLIIPSVRELSVTEYMLDFAKFISVKFKDDEPMVD